MSFFERPIVVGFFFSLVSGSWDVLLPLAIFHELFWLDVLAVGVVIPPFAPLSFLLLAALSRVFPLDAPGVVFLPLMCSLLCAYAPCRLEQGRRFRADAVAERVESALTDGDADIDALLAGSIRASLLSQAFQAALLYGLCYALLCVLLLTLQAFFGKLPCFPHITWPLIFCAGALGGVLALRTRRAFWFFLLAVCAVSFLSQGG